MLIKKLYIVRKEVYATSIARACIARGKTTYVELAKDEFQPIIKNKPGFKAKKNG